MKKIITLATIVACFALSDAKAQNVNGVRLSDIHVDYIELRAVYNRSDTYIAKLDFGQKIKRDKDLNIRDDDGNDLLFNSSVDCINKLKGYGYELFQTYVSLVGKETTRPVYILKRK